MYHFLDINKLESMYWYNKSLGSQSFWNISTIQNPNDLTPVPVVPSTIKLQSAIK